MVRVDAEVVRRRVAPQLARQTCAIEAAHQCCACVAMVAIRASNVSPLPLLLSRTHWEIPYDINHVTRVRQHSQAAYCSGAPWILRTRTDSRAMRVAQAA